MIGIIAGRVKDLHHRPVIAFAEINDNEIKGSARSVTNVHIRDVLEAISIQYPNLISKFGGHAMAAGLTLAKQNYQLFNHAFNKEVQNHLHIDDTLGKIISDGELGTDNLHISFAQLLREAGSWGTYFLNLYSMDCLIYFNNVL